MIKLLKKILKFVFLALVALVAAYVVFLVVTKPSNDRNWNTDQAILPEASIEGDLVHIKNIRNFNYRATDDYDVRYYNKTFDVKKIKNVYFVVEPFSGYVGAAHTFLSFEFEGDNFVSISVEIRKEKGESFSAWKGMLNRYELMYVVADEKDVVKLRSNYRKDLVYVYPAKTTKEKKQAIFLDMIRRVNELKVEPEFYNTLTNTCTTNIVSHVNKITPGKVPLSLDILFPANSDRLAYEVGLIDTDLPFEEARKKFLINERAEKYADSPDFSVKIRQSE